MLRRDESRRRTPDYRRAPAPPRQAALQNSAVAANDRGSLPDKALRFPGSFKETHRAVEYFNHSLDLLDRVVKIEARASCSRHTEPTHQRLVTMVSAAHGQPILVRERGEIV